MPTQKILLLRHSDWVSSVAFSPNGDRLLTGSRGKTATIWRISEDENMIKLSGHDGAVWGVGWSPSGDFAITGSRDGNARIWRSSTGELLATLSGHTGAVYGVDWSASGGHVVTASDDGTAKIWQPTTGKCIQTTEKHSHWMLPFYSNWVGAVAFSPNGDFFTTGSDHGNLRIFRIAATCSKTVDAIKPLKTLRGHSNSVYAVAWSPTGDLIASGSSDRSVRIWEVSTGRPIRTLEGHSNAVLGAAWSPNADFILTGSRDNTVRIWAAATGKTLRILSHHTDMVRAVAWSPSGNCIATASYDKTASIVHTAPPIQNKGTTADDDSKLPAHPHPTMPSSPLPSQIPKPPLNQEVPTKPPPQALKMKDDNTLSPPPTASSATAKANEKNIDDESKPPPDDGTIHSTEPPERRCFKHVEIPSFDNALGWLLLLRECPKGRPDLVNEIPDDDDITLMKEEVDIWYEKIRVRDGAKQLILTCGLTPDEVKAILCYSMENPYRVYVWLNAWLMTDRRNDPIKHHVGPFFALLYRGMEKLPKIQCRASRGVLVHEIRTLRETFDGYKVRCKKGSTLAFWGLASFSTNDDVLAQYAGGHGKDAIVYACEELECVSIRELSRFPNEEEVLPLPPCIFKVVAAQRIESKLVIGLEQMDHDEISYLLPIKTN